MKLGIETDGDSHFTDEAGEYDRERTVFIESIGIHIIRFTNEDVRKRLSAVLDSVQMELGRLSR